jgi:hypothetical protein
VDYADAVAAFFVPRDEQTPPPAAVTGGSCASRPARSLPTSSSAPPADGGRRHRSTKLPFGPLRRATIPAAAAGLIAASAPRAVSAGNSDGGSGCSI